MASKYKKTIAVLLVLVLSLGSLAACGSEVESDIPILPEVSAAPEHEPNANAADEIFSLNCNREYSFNPFTSTNASNLICAQLIYETMVEVDSTFSAVPKLVTSYETEDGINWKFTVDTAVKFWDGTALTVADAVYSVQRAMQSANYKERLRGIIGVSAADDQTMAITLGSGNTRFPVLLNIPVIKNGSVEEFVPMGTGPYIPNGDLTQMNAFSEHRNAAKLSSDTIYLKEYKDIEDIITAFENSEIDLVTNDPTGLFNLSYGSANEIRSFPTTNMHYLGFNTKSQFFSNPLCRHAMTYVIDREFIANDVMKGNAIAAALPMNPTSAIYNQAYSDIVSYSLKKSQAAFDQAEVQDYDNDGFREIKVTGIPVESDFKFVVCSDSATKVAAARHIAQNLTDLGIKVTLNELNWEKYQYALTGGDFDMYYAETKLTADFSLSSLLLKNASLNYGKFSDGAMEEYISAYRAAPADQQHNEADLMFKYISDTAPIVPICFEKQQVITHRGVVTGLKPTIYNIFQDFDLWTINTKK